MILVDTSIWGRIADKRDPLHDAAMRAMSWVIRQDSQPVIVPQTLYEFYVVATRPRKDNGLGWPAARAGAWLNACRRTCTFLADEPRLFDQWATLVTTHGTQGKPAHDARLVAAMQLYNINTILTFNARDFHRYGITILDLRTMP